MMTVELFVADEQLSTERKHQLAERILRDLTTEPAAPDSVMAKARELTHVLVRTPENWATGGPSIAGAPRYLVRLTVPSAWSNTSEFGDHIIPLITRAIADTEPDPTRLTRDPHCLVQIIGLREHNIGPLGRKTTISDITKLMTDDYRATATPAEAPEGHAIDPVCGMPVELATAHITLTHNGTDYAFCAPVCRKVFADEHLISVEH
ncbi:YHS domain-containing protein [Nocardia suismassiliense]|uniref:YHS domain-containing protein n=1 Tax=Nocardia suismassiliense TaxID=2077092 RepID=UPI000D1DE74B|nr:YHS domain-containing protein [Nocardia suismassiliense]